MSGKMYTLEVSETELARVMFVMGMANGAGRSKTSAYRQASNILREGKDFKKVCDTYDELASRINLVSIDYVTVKEEWEKALGIDEFKKSPVQQRIENLEKELDELKKLL